MLALADIIEALTGTRPTKATQAIPHAAIDSREVQAGSLFIALPGENVDGHDYVGAAFKNGAAFALIQHAVEGEFKVLNVRTELSELDLDAPLCLLVDDTLAALQEVARFWRNKLDLRVIGITGSVGKSTTKELAAQALGRRYRTLKNYGNLNNEIGLPLTILGLTVEHERAVLEM